MTWPRGRVGPSLPSGGSAFRWSWLWVWRVVCYARPNAIGAWGQIDAGVRALVRLAALTDLGVSLDGHPPRDGWHTVQTLLESRG
eukprot:1193517-Prorocentrum_minimum.AAC.1